VRIVPNHVCVSVNLQDRLYGVYDESIETVIAVEARGWQ
jgi:D-serine deaminase-like pyridoxal phosphate-dependent protein